MSTSSIFKVSTLHLQELIFFHTKTTDLETSITLTTKYIFICLFNISKVKIYVLLPAYDESLESSS